jgi:hypothetical protein
LAASFIDAPRSVLSLPDNFKTRPSIWFVALAALLTATSVFAHDVLPSDPCNAMPKTGSVAALNFLTFDDFDKELRIAISRQDALALAFLVTLPLRVNDAGGTDSALPRIFLDNRRSINTITCLISSV